MRKLLTVALFCTIVCAILSCWAVAQVTQTAPATGDLSTPDSPSVGYRLQKEDAMKVSVWNEPNFSADVLVDPAGYVSLPYLDKIYAEGLTQAELESKIRSGLTKYLVDPKVRIEIVQYHKSKVYVFGQVNRPNVYEFRTGASVVEAISMAGSFTEAANLEEADLTRRGSTEKIPLNLSRLFYEGDMTQNLVLQDGDSVFIPEMKMYSVAGEVLKQGQYRLRKGTTVMDAISNAGGTTKRGSLKSTFILRGDLANPERIKVDMAKFIKNSDSTQNILIKPGDIVYVSETDKPNWDDVGRILSSVVNATYIFRLFGF